jgi:hypothetical protein
MRLCLVIAIVAFGAAPNAPGGSVPARDEPRTLTADRLELTYSVRCLDRSAGNRLLSVDIAGVDNPRAVELAFQVHYRRPGAELVYLGSFALFPPDHPGQFIVPTQGRVGPNGQIVITMEPILDQEGAGLVRVLVGGVKLTE